MSEAVAMPTSGGGGAGADSAARTSTGRRGKRQRDPATDPAQDVKKKQAEKIKKVSVTVLPPLPQNPNEVPHDFICTVCYELPLEPVVTPCEHIFCEACIKESISRKKECPFDRNKLERSDLKPLSGLTKRLFDQIPVKCPSTGCIWTGCMAGYHTHAAHCAVSDVDKVALGKKYRQLEKEHSIIKERYAKVRKCLDGAWEKICDQQEKNVEMVQIARDKSALAKRYKAQLKTFMEKADVELKCSYDENKHILAENKLLKGRVDVLKRSIALPVRYKGKTISSVEECTVVQAQLAAEEKKVEDEECKPDFNNTYQSYGHNPARISELVELIGNNISKKPDYIDSDKLYRSIKGAWVNAMGFEPEVVGEESYVETKQRHDKCRFLLQLCLQTNDEWFTREQMRTFGRWLGYAAGAAAAAENTGTVV